LRIVGVTGGIGSGKSTVSSILAGLGAKVIDADVISKEIFDKGEKAYKELVDYFGTDILDENEEVDRKRLGGVVFGNSGKLKDLVNITHKYIIERIIEGVNEEKAKKKADLLVIDAAIPVEHGFIDVADEVWVVLADRDIRVKRIINRNGYSYSDASDRINSQSRDEEYIKIADRVLYNNGSLEELRKEIMKMIHIKPK
jgi:dephospho-CoA kinase